MTYFTANRRSSGLFRFVLGLFFRGFVDSKQLLRFVFDLMGVFIFRFNGGVMVGLGKGLGMSAIAVRWCSLKHADLEGPRPPDSIRIGLPATLISGFR